MSNCPRCNSAIKPGEMFCKDCGFRVANNQSSNQNLQQPALANINEEELVNIFIGKNVNSLKKKGFSLNAFIFGFIYVLYRKMWILGLAWFGVMVFANIFLFPISIIIAIFIRIIMGVTFKDIYIKHVYEQVTKIKLENKDMSIEYISEKCKKRGGTTIVLIIVAVAFYTVVILFIGLLIAVILNSRFLDNISDKKAIIETSPKSLEKLHLKVPNNLNSPNNIETEHKQEYSSYNMDYNCVLSLKTLDSKEYNDDAKSYLKEHNYFTLGKTGAEIYPVLLNNNIWYRSEIKKNNTTNYYYAAVHNKRLYEVNFKITDDSDEICDSDFKTIIKSMRFD